MRVFRKTGAILVLAIVPCISIAKEFQVGTTKIDIRPPGGFVEVTPAMATLYEYKDSFVPPTNTELALYITEGDVPAALRNEVPELARRFSVQVNSAVIARTITTSQFGELKQLTRDQYAELTKKAMDELGGDLMDRISNSVSDLSGIEMSFGDTQMVPLRPHVDSDREIAISMINKYTLDQGGESFDFVVAVTQTIVYVRGKAIFLYAFGGDTDLDWTRAASAKWVSQIVSDNPSDFGSTVGENMPSALSGIDWGKVLGSALAGAIIGLIFAAIAGIRRLFRRRKSE